MITRRTCADQLAVHVSHRGRIANGELVATGCFWFEPVVAHAFVGAGADEVRLNMSWAWTGEMALHAEQTRASSGEPVHRRELDVAARLGHQVLCVSCKTGDPARLEAQRHEVEAVARGSFGRLAVPILVHPNPDAELVAESRREPERAIVLGLAEITSPQQLRGVLESAFGARSTLVDE
jgi:hypothetical protein